MNKISTSGCLSWMDLCIIIFISIYFYLIKYKSKQITNKKLKVYNNIGDELKEIDIKNRTCYYFDDAIIQIFILLILLKNPKKHKKIF